MSEKPQQFNFGVKADGQTGGKKKLANKGSGNPRGPQLRNQKPASLAQIMSAGFKPYASRHDRELDEKIFWRHEIERENAEPEVQEFLENELVAKFDEIYPKMEKMKAGEAFEKYDLLLEELYQKIDQKVKEFFSNNNFFKITLNDIMFFVKNSQLLYERHGVKSKNDLGMIASCLLNNYIDGLSEKEADKFELFLPYTDNVNMIGYRMNRGKLVVNRVGDGFGRMAHGTAKLKADISGNATGGGAKGTAEIEVNEAKAGFGHRANGHAVLKAGKVGENAGHRMHGYAILEVVYTAGPWFGRNAYGNAKLKVEEANTYAGFEMGGDAELEVGTTYDFFGEKASGNVKLKARVAGRRIGEDISDNVVIEVSRSWVSLGNNRRDQSRIILGGKKSFDADGNETILK